MRVYRSERTGKPAVAMLLTRTAGLHIRSRRLSGTDTATLPSREYVQPDRA
jgi:hypothetical protein